MKRIVLILLTTIAFSCAERELQLPVTTANDITEILDVSPIYMFYDEATDSVDFNRKNMISTTNWLVNIDKRLTLKQILPHLQYLQEKRRGDGMHKNENAKNYFTCFNEDTKNLSFIEFTDISFDINNEKVIAKRMDPKYYNNLNYDIELFVDIKSKEDIMLYEVFIGHRESDIFLDFNGLLSYLKNSIKNEPFILYLSFNSKLSFQDYIKIKSEIININSGSIPILSHEVIYN